MRLSAVLRQLRTLQPKFLCVSTQHYMWWWWITSPHQQFIIGEIDVAGLLSYIGKFEPVSTGSSDPVVTPMGSYDNSNNAQNDAEGKHINMGGSSAWEKGGTPGIVQPVGSQTVGYAWNLSYSGPKNNIINK